MLWPAALLVVLLLASIAVDFSIILMGRRELRWAADAAANDAVTYGIDQAHYRNTGEIRLDADRVHEAVANSLRARGLPYELRGSPIITIDDATDEVVVALTADIPYLFADGFPGLPDTETVEVAGDATPESTGP
ncbi:MAG: hypothetical protein ACRD29_22335 [Acidimicrobiales bacterium]